jgi:hypothetical protein
MTMYTEEHPVQSHLFTLRLWVEEVGDGRCEARGKIHHILTGETIYFREWSSLLDFLKKKLEAEAST